MHTETKHITGRVSKRQVEELEKISREENIDRSSALRRVLDVGIAEYLKRKAVEEYRRGKLSLGRAAEESKVSIAELYKILEDEDIPIRIDMKNLRESVKHDFREE